MTPCFNDWKRFCAALREIASGEDGRPLTSLDAQKRAQEVLTDCGYSWSGNVTATAVRRDLSGARGKRLFELDRDFKRRGWLPSYLCL